MPDDIVRQAIDAIAGSLGHFREALCFGLVFEGVAGEIDT
jgi:hypothetical protein